MQNVSPNKKGKQAWVSSARIASGLLNWQESLQEKNKTLLLEKLTADDQKEAEVLAEETARNDKPLVSLRSAEAKTSNYNSNCKKCNYMTKLDGSP